MIRLFFSPLKSGLVIWLVLANEMWGEVRCVTSRNGQFVLYHFSWTTDDTPDSDPFNAKSWKELKENVEESS